MVLLFTSDLCLSREIMTQRYAAQCQRMNYGESLRVLKVAFILFWSWVIIMNFSAETLKGFSVSLVQCRHVSRPLWGKHNMKTQQCFLATQCVTEWDVLSHKLFSADVLVHTNDSLSRQSMRSEWVCVLLSWSVYCMCESSPQMRCLRSFLLLSWCPLISWCCRRFQNGAGGSGISFHCHDNDSDTLAPSNSDQPLYGNRNAISPAAATDNPLWKWKVPKWFSIQARLRGQQPIKVGAAEQCHPKDLRLSLNTNIKQ